MVVKPPAPTTEAPTKALLAVILQNAFPCPQDHPYFLAKAVKAAPRAKVYKGDPIAGIDCDGSIVVPVCNAIGNTVNLLVIVENDAGEFEDLLLPGAQVAGNWIRIGEKSDTIFVVADYASGLSLHEATGNCVAVALYAKNFRSVCESLRHTYPEANLVLCLGASRSADQAPIRLLCNDIARTVNAKIAVPSGATTFNHLHRNQGTGAVKFSVESAKEPFPLDSVTEATGDEEFAPAIAWPNPVNVAGLMADIVSQLSRYVVVSPESIVAIMLWTMFTHLIDVVQVAPLLLLTSPMRRCGKTSTLAVISALASRPMPMANGSAASVYRAVALKPTLLFDEAHHYINDAANVLTGIIDSGHTLTASFVWRVIGGDLQRFSTFCAKLLAMIGRPPDTTLDRCIVISLQRKPTEHYVAKFKPNAKDRDNNDLVALRARIESFAQHNRQRVRNADVDIPDFGNDRAVDNWEPLLAVASCGGPEWLQNAIDAAIALTPTTDQSKDVIEELLHEVCLHFQKSGAPFLTTATILENLNRDDEKRWPTFSKGRPLTPHDLAKLMAQVNCHSRQQRIGEKNLKVYHLSDLKGLFDGYFPDIPI
jgi:putative DNA primase/helicase